MKKRLQQITLQLSYLPRALQMAWTASRLWTVVWAILLVLQGVLPAASVYLTKFGPLLTVHGSIEELTKGPNLGYLDWIIGVVTGNPGDGGYWCQDAQGNWYWSWQPCSGPGS